MGIHHRPLDAGTLVRPRILIETARIGARLYRRKRDLAAALPGTSGLGARQILARLRAAEAECERLRRAGSPAWRPSRHVQVLAALLAEAAQAKASGSAALRSAM